MRRCWLTMIAVLLVAAPAAAQQGSLRVIAAGSVTTGDPIRTGNLRGYQPDFGISWFQPTTHWGTVNFDAHAVRSGNDPQLGRALFSIKDLKSHGLKWNFTAGDSAYTPFLTDYGFNNLFAPQVTFRGGSAAASGGGTSLSITAGRVTVMRDLFAANADALGQTLFVARASQKATKWFEVVAHASRVRTEDLQGYSYLIESGDDAGAGVRVNVTGTVQIIGDAGMTSYRRKGATNWEQKPSMLLGTRWTGKHGWFQLDAHRFSPGNFSVLNNPYADREGLFAAGEYQVGSQVRLFGGWDMFRNNLNPADNRINGTSLGAASRAYGGGRVRINSHLFVGGRIEDGARTSKPSQYSVGYESDTGARSAEWQLTFTRWNAVGRYERRSNVDISGGLATPNSTFTQDDVSGQLFYNLTKATRLFGTLFMTQRRDRTGGGQSFWQASAGTQFQLSRRNVYARAEGIIGRSRELQSDFLTPRTAFSGGLTAQVARHVALALDVYVDSSPTRGITTNPFMSRTIVRLVYTLPTGAPLAAGSATRSAKTPRGNETIEGTVFVDWNANGVRDADEEPLGGVAIVLDEDMRATADQKGHFRFDHLVGGAHLVKLDLGTVPADYDPPSSTATEVVARRDVPGVAFAVLPVGDIQGIVLQDTNGNDTMDETDRPVDGAVVVLDDGMRTEVARNGLFSFSGVRVGTHTVQMLLESLPDGAAVAGDRQIEIEVSRRDRTRVVGFLIKVDKRPEIRKVFTPRKGNGGKTESSGGGTKTSGTKTDGSSKSGGRSKTGNTKSGTTKSSETK